MAHTDLYPASAERLPAQEVPPSPDEIIKERVVHDFEGVPPEVIFPLSGSITQRRDGRWDTLSGSDVSEHGVITVGKARSIAGAKIAKLFPDAAVVANSYNRFDPNEPTMASVSKAELIRKGVDEERIILEERSFSTITQYTEMIKEAVDHGWSRITVVINDYYVPRATALYEHLGTIVENDEFQQTLKQFHAMNGTVSFVVAEEILGLVNERYTRYFDAVKQTDAYKKSILMEAKGLQDLLDGKYHVVLEPEKPRY